MSKSSPNYLIWNYFEALRRYAQRIEKIENKSERQQDTAMCVILSVTVVEAFLNVYFRVVSSESAFQDCAYKLIDLIEKGSLDQKIKDLPKIAFGKKLDLGKGSGKNFLKYKAIRNKLMHFKSTHETIHIENLVINGLADTAAFQDLANEDAKLSLETAERIVIDIFRLRGIPENDVPAALHAWTGKLPI